jgi:4-hydroxybenzoate polyprenyltransferase
MGKIFKNIIKTSRPRQWLKNLSLFVGVIFSGWLFIWEKFIVEIEAFVVFCLIASAVYIFNDTIDAPKDRLHPYKRKRPIASGALPMEIAIFSSILMAVIGLIWAINLSFFFFVLVMIYIMINILYSLYLKNQTILDVMTIASGFIIRVYAGAVVVNAHINVWLLLCIVSFALFLAIGKRRAERTMLQNTVRGKTREVLLHYPENLLTIYTAMFANSTWVTYALYTFQFQTSYKYGPVISILDDLPKAFISQKLLMITIPVVIYGVMRYLQLIYDQSKGSSPEEVLISDKPLITSVAIFGIMVIIILYGITY